MKNGFFLTLITLALLNAFSRAEILDLADHQTGEKLIESELPSFIFFKENLQKDTDEDFKAF